LKPLPISFTSSSCFSPSHRRRRRRPPPPPPSNSSVPLYSCFSPSSSSSRSCSPSHILSFREKIC
jgi:hypothetical protein